MRTALVTRANVSVQMAGAHSLTGAFRLIAWTKSASFLAALTVSAWPGAACAFRDGLGKCVEIHNAQATAVVMDHV